MTDLYRFFDAGGSLLYVGISLNAAHRASQHRAEKEWWSDVSRMEVQRIAGSRRDALVAETAAIQQERPRYNKTCLAPPNKPTASKPRAIGERVPSESEGWRWIEPATGLFFWEPEFKSLQVPYIEDCDHFGSHIWAEVAPLCGSKQILDLESLDELSVGCVVCSKCVWRMHQIWKDRVAA